MAYEPELAERMRSALHGRRGIDEKKMFGGICWTLHGNMLCGVEGNRFMFRVGTNRTEEALARDGASPMDFTGRPMRGLVWVRSGAAVDEALEDWIEFAEAFVGTLPKKTSRPSRT